LYLAAWLAVSSPALAADHIDSPGAVAEPTADITDVFAWTNADATKINLIMNVGPFDSAASFSTAVTYAFHIESTAEYGVAGTKSIVTCEFYDGVNIECWAPNSTYVTGDASSTSGIANADSSLKVFAGPRNDPFFMEFTGFTNAVAAVVDLGVLPDGTCPPVNGAISNALLDALTAGGNPVDTFSGATVQSLVVQIDRDLIDEGGPLLAVHGATYVKN
jgi:hypothetical protein